AEVWLQDDERLENNRDTLSMTIGWPKQALVINEIMFNPEPGAPEWIQLYNPGPLAVSPAGWRIRDASGRTAVVAVAAGETVPPGGYAVVAADPSVRLAYAIPEGSPVWSAAPFPALNNRSETVALLDFAGFEIDSVAYALVSSLPRNVSLERVREDRPATDPQNWQASVDSAGATPGRFNSVSPLEFDAAVDGRGLTLSPNPATRQDWLQIHVLVRNIGRQPVQLTQASLWLAAADEPYSPQTVADARELAQTLGVGEKRLVTFEWQPPQSGRFTMQIEIEAANDERAHNNRFEFELPVGYVRGDAVINEIMARPEDGQPEWIEVINLLDAPLDLSGWRVADARSTSGPVLENTWLAPGELLVLAQEPVAGLPETAYRVLDDWPSLNNDRDRLMLLDFNGGIIDSLDYVAPASPGMSLERIQPGLSGNDASNWSSSVDPAGSTPGRRNSVFVDWLPEASALSVSPNPFSPDSDGHEDFALIRYDLPMVTGRVHLFVFDIRGRRVRQLLNNAPTGSQRTVIWDGRDDAGRVLPLGLYFVHLQAIDAGNGVLVNQTATVALAKRW
ncbi:MAG: lamin tail domain-containing protein, partial [candidate division KSB1 bacterium]|nr:lamin tail domain-containing protein [candidate division KSB1 bacterium]